MVKVEPSQARLVVTYRLWLPQRGRPKLSDECPGRLPIVSTTANSPCDNWRRRQIGNCGPGVFRSFARLARFLRM
jgi:hypothetical protein